MSRSTVQFNLRINPELRAQLQRSADANRRSVTEEINDRLRRSLEAEPNYARTIPEVRGLIEVVHDAMNTSGDIGIFIGTGASLDQLGKGAWLDDGQAFDRAVRAAQTVLQGFRPKGEFEPTASEGEQSPEFVGQRMLRAIAAENHLDPSPEGVARMNRIRRNLGRLRDRLTSAKDPAR